MIYISSKAYVSSVVLKYHHPCIFLAVPFKPAGPAAAAITCALSIFVQSLRSHPTLFDLSIILLRGEYLEIMAQGGMLGGSVADAGQGSLPRLWRRVLVSLEQLIKVGAM